MTRKDYTLIASAFAELLSIVQPNQFHGIRALALKLADKLEQAHPNFNKQKFIDACYGK